MTTTPDIDVRLYSSAGTRLRFPRDWWDELEFEIGESGGMQNGSITIVAPWEYLQPNWATGGQIVAAPEQQARLLGSGEALQLTGTERLDVYLFGRLVYRGWLRLTQCEIGVPDRSQPTLYGLMEKLNGFLVNREFTYPDKVDIGQLFLDMTAQFVTTASRLPALTVDATGVASLGILVQQFDPRGKSFPQAMNSLLELAPNQLIWGGGVTSGGGDLLYLYPRATQVGWKFAIGESVTAFTYPRDVTQVVNRLYITGSQVDPNLTPAYPANLAPNASFEEGAVPGATGSNLLLNGDFETGSGGSIGSWSSEGNPTIDGSYAQSGSQSLVLDNNPSAPEGIYQEVPYAVSQQMTAKCWGLVTPSQSWGFQFRWQLCDSAGAFMSGYTGTSPIFVPPPDNVWRPYIWSFTPPQVTGQAFLKLIIETPAAGAGTPAQSGGHGCNIDNVSLYSSSDYACKSWNTDAPNGGVFALLDWANHDFLPMDGGLMIKAVPTLTGGAGSYVAITTTPGDRASCEQNTQYAVNFFVNTLGVGAQVQIGCRTYNSSTSVITPHGTALGPVQTVSLPGWTPCTMLVTTGTGDDQLQPFIRLLTNGATYYIDGAGIYLGSLVPDLYYPADTLTGMRDVTYAPFAGQLSAAALQSISLYGERESAQTQETILDSAGLNAYALGYLNAFAVPAVQGRLTIKDIASAADLVGLSGQVALLNLPQPPPPLCPARVRVKVAGGSVDMDIDLNNERPDLAMLIRQAGQADVRTG